jgi:hypothetical protein
MEPIQYNCSKRTLLPLDFLKKKPKYYVWFTGTVGQADWLISYSRELRGQAWPIDYSEQKKEEGRWPSSI